MDFLELSTKRYSCRKYLSKQVRQEDIDKIIQACKLAPTAHNYQPQEIIVVNSKEGLEKLNKCTECHYNPPLAFIICYNKSKAWVRDYDNKCSGDVDASIVATHMMLEAKDLGLDSVWIMYFIPEAIKVEFELANDIEPVALLYVGYADDEASANHTTRRSIEEYVKYR